MMSYRSNNQELLQGIGIAVALLSFPLFFSSAVQRGCNKHYHLALHGSHIPLRDVSLPMHVTLTPYYVQVCSLREVIVLVLLGTGLLPLVSSLFSIITIAFSLPYRFAVTH